MATPPNTSRPLSSDEFRNVIGQFASGVTVITTLHDDQPFGTTASAVSSLSLDPPMLLICMNKTSTTGQAIQSARTFAVNILGEEQVALAGRFASKDPDKFAGVETTPGAMGEPLIAGALAHLECRVTEEATGGTHWVFLAAVEAVFVRAGRPLAYFGGKFGRLEVLPDDQAVERLRRWIGENHDLWGQPLDIAVAAEQLELQPSSVYLILTELAKEGLVSRLATGGFLVAPVTLEIVDAALDARGAILLGAADLVIGKVSAEEIQQLRAAMERSIERMAKRGEDFDAYWQADTEFHEAIVRFTHSEMLLQAYRRAAVDDIFADHFARERAPRENFDTGIDTLGRDHREMVEGFEKNDPELVRNAILRHTAEAKQLARRARSSSKAPPPS